MGNTDASASRSLAQPRAPQLARVNFVAHDRARGSRLDQHAVDLVSWEAPRVAEVNPPPLRVPLEVIHWVLGWGLGLGVGFDFGFWVLGFGFGVWGFGFGFGFEFGFGF